MIETIAIWSVLSYVLYSIYENKKKVYWLAFILFGLALAFSLK